MSGEKSGKDMLLKIAEDLTAAITGGNVFLKPAHGISPGDLIRFTEAEGTSIVTSRYYFAVDGTIAGGMVSDGSLFSVALTPDGTAITVDATDATVNYQAFKTIGGLRTSSFSFSSDNIEVSNHGSNQWKYIKAGAGMRSAAVSGAGVYTNAANYRAMEVAAFASAHVRLAFLDVNAGRIYDGYFKISSLEASGEYDGEASFSISADSNGTIAIAQLGT